MGPPWTCSCSISRHQLILVTPYDGRSEGGVLAQQREYELELTKKYDYVFVADWHQNRASLACALVAGPEVLILDEPTVGLDPLTREDLWNAFQDLAAQGATLLVSKFWRNYLLH